tara:strand:+ start:124 stop:1050 length:927 start_codon:yes stop_codon:yes gene_type:complete
MATLGNYFLDAATLSGATAVFTDATLTTAAPDGYYSDSTVVRQQSGGVLLLGAVSCPSCSSPCGTSITVTGVSAIYDINYNVGSDIGATIIYFNAGTIPDGIRALYNSTYYNNLTSTVWGYLSSSQPTNFTYVGITASDCSIGTTLDGGGYTSVVEKNFNGSNFDTVGTSGTVTGTSADVVLTSTDPRWCTLYFPKTSTTPDNSLVQIFGPCPATGWDIEINCPAVLTGVPGRVFGAVACLSGDLSDTYFNVPNRGGTAGDPQLHEFLCLDEYGINRAPADTYVIEVGGVRKKIIVDANGVITLVSVC